MASESGSNPVILTLTLLNEVVLCGATSRGLVTATGPGTETATITVTMPDGSTQSGVGIVTIAYPHKQAECGTTVDFAATIGGSITTANQKVIVAKVEFDAMSATGAPSKFDNTKFSVTSKWKGSIKVTPKEAAPKIQLRFEQTKNTLTGFIKGGQVLNNQDDPDRKGVDSGFSSDPPVVNDNIVNITGGDIPGPFGWNWQEFSKVAAAFDFNLYLRIKTDGPLDMWTTVGKLFWKWRGILTNQNGKLTPGGNSEDATGQSNSEEPLVPPDPK